jgi:hypothetical protein
MIDYGQYGVVSITFGESGDEIHGDVGKWLGVDA